MSKTIFRTLICAIIVAAFSVSSANAKSVYYPKVAKKAAVVPVKSGYNDQEAIRTLMAFYNKVLKNGCTSKYSHVRAGISPRMLQTLMNQEAIIDCNCFTGAGGDMCDDSVKAIRALGNHRYRVVIRGHYAGESKQSGNYYYTSTKTVTVIQSGGKYLIDSVN